MKPSELKRALGCAVRAARAAGQQMRKNLRATKRVNSSTQYDIKLELDVRNQRLIQQLLHHTFPDIGFLGEEGDSETDNAPWRWVVDPIDGTVNFAYGIPHACVSIALQERPTKAGTHKTVVGVVYDPFSDELWTAIRGQPARLNGTVIHVSNRRKLSETIVSTGFAKNRASLERGLPYFLRLVRQGRKGRMMGSAALSLTYVATGRFDAYIERGVSLWDIAAGGLIIECAGGRFWHQLAPEGRVYRLLATNGLIHHKLPLPK
jgi:myo-inositol-1(or 4)-monophosphatase